MIPLYLEAIAPCNLPLTALLGMVIFYWLFVSLGALDFDLDIIDFGDAGDLGDHPAGPINTGGAWMTFGNAIGFGRVPIVVWGSFFVLFLWAGAMLLNHTFNPIKSISLAALLLLPNLVGATVVTRIAVWPLEKVFTAMAAAQAEIEKVIHREATVISVEVDESYGQIEIANAGAPVRINARVRPGTPPILRGSSVRVIEAGPDELFYFIEPIPSSSNCNP